MGLLQIRCSFPKQAKALLLHQTFYKQIFFRFLVTLLSLPRRMTSDIPTPRERGGVADIAKSAEKPRRQKAGSPAVSVDAVWLWQPAKCVKQDDFDAFCRSEGVGLIILRHSAP